jgi:hypothetical protein
VSTRTIVAAILSMVTVTLMAVTLIGAGDLCHPNGWTESWSWIVVGLFAAGAMFASVRRPLSVRFMAAVVAGTVVGGGFWLLLVGSWVSACTA